jgi:hypothetical protein
MFGIADMGPIERRLIQENPLWRKRKAPGHDEEELICAAGAVQASISAALYVVRYGVPPAGKAVWVRTRQHINGWNDLPKTTSLIVPSA